MSEHVQIIKPGYRPWWPVWTMGAATALLAAIAMTFTLITSVQRAERAENRAERSSAEDDCYQLYGALITDTTQDARTALNNLVITISRESLNPTDEDTRRAHFDAAVRELERTNLIAEAAIQARRKYLDDGSPLPCPIDITQGG